MHRLQGIMFKYTHHQRPPSIQIACSHTISITPHHACQTTRPQPRLSLQCSHDCSLLPNTKPPRHKIRTLLEIRSVIALVKQTLDIIVLCHLPPLIPLFLLLHDFLRERSRRSVLDAVICYRCQFLPLLFPGFVVVLALLALLAA
jgi:hypothetical protein